MHGVCPYLLSADGAWRSASAAREHRCTAVTPPAPLAAEKQRRLCLTADHVVAARPSSPPTRRAAVGHRPGRPAPRPIARTTPLVLDQGRLAIALPSITSAADRRPGRARSACSASPSARSSSPGSRPVAAATAGVVVPVGSATPGAAVDRRRRRDHAGAGHRRAAAPDAEPAEAPTPTVEPSPTLVPTGPSPTPGRPRTRRPTRSRAGDTLSGIAAAFGTTVKVLAELNDIKDPSKLRVGQVIKLP